MSRGMKTWSRWLPEIQTKLHNNNNNKKTDLCDFNHSVIVSAKWANLNVSEKMGFSCTNLSTIYRFGPEKEKT